VMGEVNGRTLYIRNCPEDTWRLMHMVAGSSPFDDMKSWLLDAIHKQARAQWGDKLYEANMKLIHQRIEQEQPASAPK